MATITYKDIPVNTIGKLPELGSLAPSFDLVDPQFAPVASTHFATRRIVLNIFPSIDTGVCAASVRRFNEIAVSLDDAAVVCVSKDLPFALGRFCAAEGIENVITASAFRSTFGEDYGVTMIDGPIKGLLARSIVVVDTSGKVIHTELVPVTGQEPDYEAALAVLR